MIRRFLSILVVLLCFSASAHAQEALPGEACTATNNLRFTSGPEVAGGGGHALLCQGGTWKSILSFNSAAGLTKLGNQTCATNEILKFNGTTWACAADASGMSGLPALTSTNIWVGNASNAATAVAMSGDGTLSNAGVLTIGSNAVGSAEITDGGVGLADLAANSVNASKIVDASVALADLSATGTASATTYLRGDNTWGSIPSSVWVNGATAGEIYYSAGNVGIGVADPQQPLDVAGFIRTGGSIYLDNLGALPNSMGVSFRSSGSEMALIHGYTTDGISGAILFNTNNAGTNVERMRLLPNGSLALGKPTAATLLDVNGTATATLFSGSGASLTNLNAANLASGTVPVARLGASGTPSATTYLRGDNTWATVSTALPGLTSANIWVGNGSNVATAVTMSGDATMTNAGVLTLGTGVVTTLEILDSTIASADIAADTIAAVDIATGGVATAEILDNTIAAIDIAPDAITASELATSAVTTTEILDSTIASADIAADTIAAVDIATGGVGTAEILDGTITAADIAADAVTASEIAANAVTSSELATDSVTIAKLAATGTAGTTTFLRGDNTWAVPAGGGGADPGTLCGVAKKSGCDISCSDNTSPAYTSVATCNGASVVSSCPSGYTLRTTAWTTMTSCGDSNSYLACMRNCSKN